MHAPGIAEKIVCWFKMWSHKRFLAQCLKDRSALIEHAIAEFKYAGWMDSSGKFCDEGQEFICVGTLRLLKMFSSQEHSGSSAHYAIALFKSMASFEIIGSLKGTDDEWCEHDGLWQNKRCSHVFKNADGFTYDTEGRIFSENGNRNNTFITGCSSTFVEFPYKPHREYVHLDGELSDKMRSAYVKLEQKRWKDYKKAQGKQTPKNKKGEVKYEQVI